MIVERNWEAECPVIKAAVRLRELTALDGGGSCQVDMQPLERTCEKQGDCPGGAGCLLADD